MTDEHTKTWRCYHCDELFTDRGCAEIHFGRTEYSEPACQIKRDSEYHLIRYIRELESQLAPYRNESDAITLAWLSREANHTRALVAAEEAGYNKGVQDMKAMQLAGATL